MGRWSGNIAQEGQFDYSGKIPFQVPTNGTIINGWFNETCPGFDYKKPVAKFIHIDCDVYESTVDVFNTLTGKIVPGTVIVFDDYQENRFAVKAVVDSILKEESGLNAFLAPTSGHLFDMSKKDYTNGMMVVSKREIVKWA